MKISKFYYAKKERNKMKGITEKEKSELKEIFSSINNNGVEFEDISISLIGKNEILSKTLYGYYWDGCKGSTDQEEFVFGKKPNGEWERIKLFANYESEFANRHEEGSEFSGAKSVGEQLKEDRYKRLCLVSIDFRDWANSEIVNDFFFYLEDNLSKKERKEELKKERELEKKILQCIGEIKKHNFLAHQGMENYEKKHGLIERLLCLDAEASPMSSMRIKVTLIEAREDYYDLYEIDLVKDGEFFGICHVPKEIADGWQIAEWALSGPGGRRTRDSYEEFRRRMGELEREYREEERY